MPKSKKIPRKIIHQFVDLAHDETKIPELIAMLEAYPALLNTPRLGKDKETAMGAAIHGSGVSEKYIQFWLAPKRRDGCFYCLQAESIR